MAISYSTLDFSGGHGINVVITDMVSQKLAFSVVDQAGEVIIVCEQRTRELPETYL